jgi:hypothetical protein
MIKIITIVFTVGTAEWNHVLGNQLVNGIKFIPIDKSQITLSIPM